MNHLHHSTRLNLAKFFGIPLISILNFFNRFREFVHPEFKYLLIRVPITKKPPRFDFLEAVNFPESKTGKGIVTAIEILFDDHCSGSNWMYCIRFLGDRGFELSAVSESDLLEWNPDTKYFLPID